MEKLRNKLNKLLAERAELEAGLFDRLYKSILQEAIQGRLVPQIESEGTADELLEEIHAEKKRLVKEGKLKKSAITNERRIFRGDDNKYKLQSGDLLICEGGDVGRCSIWTSNIDMWYQNALHRVRPFTGINVYYLKSLIEYYKGIGLIDKICKGVTIKHFTQNALCSLLIPLPPYKEQYRIIQKLEELQKMTL